MPSNNTFHAAVLWLAIGAAGVAWYVYNQHQGQQSRERAAARRAAGASQLAAAPTMRKIATPEGTLIEMRVPVDTYGLGIIEHQTCYVWRDATAPSASLSCTGKPEIAAEDGR